MHAGKDDDVAEGDMRTPRERKRERRYARGKSEKEGAVMPGLFFRGRTYVRIILVIRVIRIIPVIPV